MPYSRVDKFNSERNFTQLHFGRTKLSEIELNEMQKTLLEQSKNGIRLLLNDGLINVRRFDITNNILILDADAAVIQGQAILFREPITLVLPQTHTQLNVYLKVYEVVVKYDEQVPKYGNRNSNVLIPIRDILDDNLQGAETARRIQIQYELIAIAGTDTTSDKKLTLGTISATKILTNSFTETKGMAALETELVNYIDDQIEGLSTVATSGSYNDLSNKPTLGNVASRNTGTTNGTIPIIGSDNKIDASILPAIAITDTFVVTSQNAMLALTAQIGDIAVRTDINKSFILKANGASSLANWQELLSPISPVQSVAGKTGAVSLTKGDVGLGNVDNTSDLEKPISTAVQNALNSKASIGPATTNTAGVMSALDKTKLDGIDVGANNYSLPTATSFMLGGVKTGTNITNSSGTISVPDGTTSEKGVVQLSTAINSTATTLAATASAVKTAYDRAEQAFQSASNGKLLIANAITGKGYQTSGNATFEQMAANITAINTGPAKSNGTQVLSSATTSIEDLAGNIRNLKLVTVSNLTFAPRVITLYRNEGGSYYVTTYDGNLNSGICVVTSYYPQSGSVNSVVVRLADNSALRVTTNGFILPIYGGSSASWKAEANA